MGINANWMKGTIFETLRILLNTINTAKTVEDIAEKYPRINVDSFPNVLDDEGYILLFDPSAEFNGPLANMKYGPMKTTDSCMRKVAEYRKEHAAEGGQWDMDGMYVLDQLRLTISTANPMVAAIVVEALLDIPLFEVVGIKNKYLGSFQDVMKTGSPSILVNVLARHCALPPIIFEVQVYIDAFLSLKHSQHKTYEFKRAQPANLLYPIVIDTKNHHEIIRECATPEERAKLDSETFNERENFREILRIRSKTRGDLEPGDTGGTENGTCNAARADGVRQISSIDSSWALSIEQRKASHDSEGSILDPFEVPYTI